MNALQKFEEANREKLQIFLEEYNPGHDKLQMEYFIVGSGITDYGKYKQALAEIHTHYSSLQTSYIEYKKAEVQIEILEAEKEALLISDNKVDSAKAKLKDIEIEEQQFKLQNIDKRIKRSMYELTTMFELAQHYEKEIEGKDRNQLMVDYHKNRLAKMIEMNVLFQGGNLSGVMDTITMLPEPIVNELLPVLHSAKIQSLSNHEHYALAVEKQKALPSGESND